MIVEAAVILALQSGAWQSEIRDLGWTHAAKDSDGTTVMMLRPASGGRVWARWEVDGVENGPPSRAELYQVDCAAQTFQRLQGTAYRRRNLEGSTTHIPPTYRVEYPIPGSFGETIVAAACLPEGFELEDLSDEALLDAIERSPQ